MTACVKAPSPDQPALSTCIQYRGDFRRTIDERILAPQIRSRHIGVAKSISREADTHACVAGRLQVDR